MCYSDYIYSYAEGVGGGEGDDKPRERYEPEELPQGDGLFTDRNTYYEGSGINFDAFDNIPVQVSFIYSLVFFYFY